MPSGLDKKVYALLNCSLCGKEYLPVQTNQRYCSKECNNKYWRDKRANHLNLPTGTVGAMSELLVSVDLMRKGYEVYRALSQSSSSDILVLKDNLSYCFEIRTGLYNADKTLSFSKNNIRAKNIAIVVYEDMTIHYVPSLDRILAK